MTLSFGREICGHLSSAEQREWLVTNGLGGYACGTVAGMLTRHYHGLLVAALQPPVERVFLLAKLDEQVEYGRQRYDLSCDRKSDGSVTSGFRLIEHFTLKGTTPAWTFACADAQLEKQIWMQPGANTTYVRYTLKRAQAPLTLRLTALVNYRDHGAETTAGDWPGQTETMTNGLKFTAHQQATPLYLLSTEAKAIPTGDWRRGYRLAIARDRGLPPSDDHYAAGDFEARLEPGSSVTLVASTEPQPELSGDWARRDRDLHERQLLERWQKFSPQPEPPNWIAQLVLAADQFIVYRPLAGGESGQTVIAGYPWFTDWGRDTMIALPGLTLATGRPDIAHTLLKTFAQYLDRGMLPNVFPDVGETPIYNTVDAILWYFEAVRTYYSATQDKALLETLFPALDEVIDWHRRGTRYNIHLDPKDHLIYAGEAGVQLTWMDAKVDDWVVTPRIGKPVEISALWHNALLCMVQFSEILGKSPEPYQQMAEQTQKGFQRFWNPAKGYCYDLLDTPDGNDDSLRPNQIFALSLTLNAQSSLLTPEQKRAIVDVCAQQLLTSYGLRSLAPNHRDYHSHYIGDRYQRDGAYHQGTVWGWLIGPFIDAHYQVYQDRRLALSFFQPMADHLSGGCIGNLSEIFDGEAPHQPRGTYAQAWTVAEVLRTWTQLQQRSRPQ